MTAVTTPDFLCVAILFPYHFSESYYLFPVMRRRLIAAERSTFDCMSMGAPSDPGARGKLLFVHTKHGQVGLTNIAFPFCDKKSVSIPT
jgi:hypothetical protein